MAKKTSKTKAPNSSYYRNKADEMFMAQFRGEPCAICQSINATCGHHIVAKSISKALRYNKTNIIVLCQSHHMFSNTIAAHSSNAFAQNAFMDFIKEKYPEKFDFCAWNQHLRIKYTYKQALANFKAGKEAWE